MASSSDIPCCLEKSVILRADKQRVVQRIRLVRWDYTFVPFNVYGRPCCCCLWDMLIRVRDGFCGITTAIKYFFSIPQETQDQDFHQADNPRPFLRLMDLDT